MSLLDQSQKKLTKYRTKRNFLATPEPEGGLRPKGRTYVVQKHAARQLHYDLRLEHAGVLLSWAVPKEPSLDPSIKRLAVHVEDHPIEYANFEGRIPEGHYGAGTVEIWDRGTWKPLYDVDEGLEKGKLTFEIMGERLKGRFALIRMNTKDGKDNWLLIKEEDDQVILEKDKKDFWPASLTLPATLDLVPTFMLCRAYNYPPAGEGWGHEIKWDGYRAMACVTRSSCHLILRGGTELHLPKLQKALLNLIKVEAKIDGELVVFDENGRSNFSLLKDALSSKSKEIHFVAFDLLFVDGYDIRQAPLEERKRALQSLIPSDNAQISLSKEFLGSGTQVHEAACKLGLEGIISKRLGSVYQTGRSDNWRKIKCLCSEEMIVGGFTLFGESKVMVGSLLVGQMEGGKFHFMGRIGTGYDEQMRRELFQLLNPLVILQPPFDQVDRFDRRRAIWVQPKVKIRANFLTKTGRGMVRQARFGGIVNKESRKKLSGNEVFKVTHGERIIDSESNTTKQMVADYYVSVLDKFFPHVKGRLVTLIRCPDGIGKQCFFQRRSPESFWRGTRPILLPGEEEEYIEIIRPEGVLQLIQFGTIEFHPWGSLAKDPERPNQLIFDIDPDPTVSWKQVTDAAFLTKERLEALGLHPFLKLSGGKGLHLVCPIKPELEWGPAKAFTKTFVTQIAAEFPKDFVATMSKKARKSKIFIDFERNDRTATAVAPYSLRARAGLPIAAPIPWSRLKDFKAANQITILSYKEIMDEPDPWAGFLKSSVSIKTLLKLN